MLTLIMDYFADTEFHIWDIIFCCLDEDRNDVLGYLISLYIRHHCCEGVKAAHSEIVPFLLCIEVACHIWDVFSQNPFLLEVLSQGSALLYAHFSYTGSCVGEISHKDGLKMFAEDLLAKDETKFGNELQDCHTHSPLAFFCHFGQSFD